LSFYPLSLSVSHRQIHPVCEDRTQLHAYENKPAPAAILATSPSISLDPPSYPAPPPLPTYPLTPNICVEGGRIEFIKTPPDVATDRKFPPATSSSSSTSSLGNFLLGLSNILFYHFRCLLIVYMTRTTMQPPLRIVHTLVLLSFTFRYVP